MAVLAEYNSINDLFGLEENYSDPDKMDKQWIKRLYKTKLMRAWEIDTKLEIAMDALRTPDDTPIKKPSGGASSCSIMSFVVATA
jgi:hypothetical protein